MRSYSRREWLGAAGAGLCAGLKTELLALQARSKPNVILILADDLGYSDLGCYGQKQIATPHLDRLAAEGLRFTQAYAGSTVCAPSRCALMTGKHTGHATVRGNRQPHVPLREEERTIASIFKDAGYATGAFGKWGLGTPPDIHAFPTAKGFDEFFGYLHQVHAHTYYPDMLWENDREMYLPANFGGARKLYSHDLIAGRALEFIDRNKNGPFFLYAPFTPPHGRFEAPDDGEYAQKPWPPQARTIASMISRLDATVGQIVARVREHGLERDTLILFTSDNGPGGFSVKNFASNGPLRGFKRDLYEGGIRVPFIARWTGRIQPGVSSDVMAFWDMLPTFAELLQVPCPPDVDGIPMLSSLLGKRNGAQTADRTLYWEFHEKGFEQAIRWRNYKAVRHAPGQRIELYDLAVDPGETNDLAPERSSLVVELTTRLNSARTPSEWWLERNSSNP